MTTLPTPAGASAAEDLDVLVRLRQRYPETPHHRDELHREAADEIEKLRAELKARVAQQSGRKHSCSVPGCAVCDPTAGL